MRLKPSLKQRGQVIFLGFGPQLVEPVPHLAHHMGRVVAQVQLQVGGQARIGEVGRPGHHPVGAVPHQEGLAVQEPSLQAAHLNILRAQPLHQSAGIGISLDGEPEMIPLYQQVVLVVLQRPAQPGAGRPLRICRFSLQRPPAALRRSRLGTQQQPHAGDMIQRIGQQRVPAHIEVGSGNVQAGSAHESSCGMGNESVQRPRHRLLPPVDRQLRFLNCGHGAS